MNQFTTLTVNPKTNMIYVLSSIPGQYFIIIGTISMSYYRSSKSIEQNTLSTILSGSRTIMAINTYNNKIYQQSSILILSLQQI